MIVPPHANEPPDWDDLARHRAGETVGDEARRIDSWLKANPLDAEMLSALDAVLAGERSGDKVDAPDVETALRAVHARMHDDTPARVIPFPTVRATAARSRQRTGWIAGGLAAAAIVALAFGIGRTRDVGDRPVAVAARGAAGSIVTTGVGIRDSVRLLDGTRVVLAPGSRLDVSPSFGRASREVTIQGMAWLAVHHDAAVPFTVRAGDAVVRDVGTQFTVRTGTATRDPVLVSVREGSVELRSATAATSGVMLAAGDRGELDTDGRVVAERGAASDADVAWMDGRLVFRDARMDQVRVDLRRWYGVQLQFADSAMVTRRVTATFDGEPVDRALQVIALALGARVERRDTIAVLRP
jgi:transmembrane sensor